MTDGQTAGVWMRPEAVRRSSTKSSCGVIAGEIAQGEFLSEVKLANDF